MNGGSALGHNSALQGYTGPVTTWSNEIVVWYKSCTRYKIDHMTFCPTVQYATTVPRLPKKSEIKVEDSVYNRLLPKYFNISTFIYISLDISIHWIYLYLHFSLIKMTSE